MDINGAYVFRDYVTEGIPSSGPNPVNKPDARRMMARIEGTLRAIVSAGGKLYTSRAAMEADLAPAANTPVLVIGDPVAENNGLYMKSGASGVGLWIRVGDVPGYQFVRAENVGAGTPNAIIAVSALPISGDTLVYLPVLANNTASPVTVSFNGGDALTIKTNGGNDVVAGGLVAGMVMLGVVSGVTFRLVSDQASAAIVAAAEGWANIAQAAANNNLTFVNRAAAIVATINASIHSITLKGDATEGDGLGSLFVDTNNGSNDTFTSADGRTWYRAADVGGDRLLDKSVGFDKLTDEVSGYLSDNGWSADFDLRRDTQKGFIRYNFNTGMSAFQGHAFDEINRHLYTLQHSDDGNGGAGGPATISRYAMDAEAGVQLIDQMNTSSLIGHQTLAVEYLKLGGVKLWAPIGPKFSRGLIRFDYTAAGDPANVETYQLADPSIFGNSHVTGSISYDQKWIVLRALSYPESSYAGKNCILVFDLRELVAAGPGDRWNLARHVWTEEPTAAGDNPQSVISDGKFIYTLYGPLSIALPNIIRQYTFRGILLDEVDDVSVAKADSASLSGGTSNEFEGAQFVRLRPDEPPVLSVGFIQGGPTYYKRIWVFGQEFNPRKGYVSVNKSSEGANQVIASNANVKITFPSIFLQSGRDFDTANSRLVPKAGRKYLLNAQLEISAGVVPGSLAQIYIYKNGSVYRRAMSFPPASATVHTMQITCVVDEGNGSDYYEIYAYHNGAGNKEINLSGGRSWWDAVEL